ncbi:hypothetical protein JXO52_07785 [bacterium]|nr:hypothetical protein [bacterium]
MQTIHYEQSMAFNRSALIGHWRGKAENRTVEIHLDLDVNAEGHVHGSGVRSLWMLVGNGVIIGNGSFTFIADSSQIISSAHWELHIIDGATRLGGRFTIDHRKYNKLKVDLRRCD